MGATVLSPDGTRLAVSWYRYDAGERVLRMFAIPSGRELKSLKGADSQFGSLAFSPDGTRLAAVGRTVKVWDPATGQELITLRDMPGGVANLEFSRDGHRLRAVAWTGGKYVVKTWDATPRAAEGAERQQNKGGR